MDSKDRQISLKDGRSLGYVESGDPTGKPVFCFHGSPGSRLDWNMFAGAASDNSVNARIIMPDRPGMGLSDFQKGRRLLDWPDDVSELADALQIERFAVLGISGGGPYALACAYKNSDRVSRTAILSGMGPSDAPGMKAGTSWTYPGKPAIFRKVLLRLTAMGLEKSPERIESQMVSTATGPDQLLFQNSPEIPKRTLESWREAFRSGVDGVQQDASIYTRPWGFRLQDVTAAIHLWHGEEDDNVPVSAGHYVADALPNCQSKFIREEGHFSLAYRSLDECLGILVA